MLSNLFIYLIGLLLAIQSTKAVVTIDPTSCAPYAVTVRTSVDEMVEMIQAAYTSTENTYNGQGTQAQQRVVFNTFNSYFPTNDPAVTARDLLCMSPLPQTKYLCSQPTRI